MTRRRGLRHRTSRRCRRRRIGGGLEDLWRDALEDGLNGAEGVDGGGEGFDVEAERMGGAGVASMAARWRGNSGEYSAV